MEQKKLESADSYTEAEYQVIEAEPVEEPRLTLIGKMNQCFLLKKSAYLWVSTFFILKFKVMPSSANRPQDEIIGFPSYSLLMDLHRL